MSEEVHPRADELDAMSTLDLVGLMNAEDRRAVAAIEPHLDDVARAVNAIVERVRAGGRIHYFGAGTSGLLAAMDAAECPATFGVGEEVVQAHAVIEAGAEDDRALGATRARNAGLGSGDVAIGVSASGGTPYVLGAIDVAKDGGALTVAVTARPGSELGNRVEIAIEVETGPEVIAGSTRLKAGTIQKLVLNMLSTATFTRLGKTRRGRMVGVVAANDKLRERAARIVSDLSGLSIEESRRRLDATGGDVGAALGLELGA